MNENIETVIEDKPKNDTKNRLISMVVLSLSLGVSIFVLMILILGQVLFGLFAKEQNMALKQMGKKISDYVHESLAYLTFNSDERPFPYRGWDDSMKQQDLVMDIPAENS